VALGEGNVAPDTIGYQQHFRLRIAEFAGFRMNASPKKALSTKPFVRHAREWTMRKVFIGAIAVAMIGGIASAQGALGASRDRSTGRIPSFNVEPSCKSSAARSTVPVGSTVNTAEICMRKESEARDQMTKEWDQFAAADKSYCVPLSTQGGTPTYTELLTCLELAREARNLKDKDLLESSTTGMGGTLDRTSR
jgi:hypothetical protein